MQMPGPIRFAQNLSRPPKGVPAIQEASRKAAQKQVGASAQQEQAISGKLKRQHQVFGSAKLFAVEIDGKNIPLTGQDFLKLLDPDSRFIMEKRSSYYYSYDDKSTLDTVLPVLAEVMAEQLTAGFPDVVKVVPVKFPRLKLLFQDPPTLTEQLEKHLREALHLKLVDYTEKTLDNNYIYCTFKLSKAGESLL